MLSRCVHPDLLPAVVNAISVSMRLLARCLAHRTVCQGASQGPQQNLAAGSWRCVILHIECSWACFIVSLVVAQDRVASAIQAIHDSHCKALTTILDSIYQACQDAWTPGRQPVLAFTGLFEADDVGCEPAADPSSAKRASQLPCACIARLSGVHCAAHAAHLQK